MTSVPFALAAIFIMFAIPGLILWIACYILSSSMRRLGILRLGFLAFICGLIASLPLSYFFWQLDFFPAVEKPDVLFIDGVPTQVGWWRLLRAGVVFGMASATIVVAAGSVTRGARALTKLWSGCAA